MMKKLVSVILAFAICGAFFIPVYAEDDYDGDSASDYESRTVAYEVIADDVITLPSAIVGDSDETDDEPTEFENEAGVFQTPPQTPGGAGTLLEDVTQCEVNRQFITVRSRGGNIFYIIIDNDRNTENVYFLSAVNDWDLITFSENFPDGVWEAYEELKAEAAELAIQAEILANTEVDEYGNPVVSDNPDDCDDEPEAGGNTQTIILVVVGIAFAGGFAYFKFGSKFRGKKKSVKMPSYNDEDEDDDESEGE